MATGGNINNTYNEHIVEWLIPNFFSIFAKNNKYYDSPIFSFNDAIWFLRIYLNGNKKGKSIKFHDVGLCRRSGAKISLNFSLSIKNVHGDKEKDAHFIHDFKENDASSSAYLISLSEISKRKSELLPAGAFTVVCAIKCLESNEYKGDNESEKCFSCKQSLNGEFISFHKKCIDRPIKCSECSDVISLQELFNDHECEKEREEDDGSLSEDFKKMLEDGINQDLILKISDKEFKAHKDVLRARSQVFKSMLEHNMKEKNSGIIDVSDCDPQAMEVFLLYMYSGNFDALEESNMLQLYYIADKYEMTTLKNKCCRFIKQSLSVTNISDVIQLALNHSDSGLLNFATGYFIDNALDILPTVGWQSLLREKSTVANELIIKAYKKQKINCK